MRSQLVHTSAVNISNYPIDNKQSYTVRKPALFWWLLDTYHPWIRGVLRKKETLASSFLGIAK